MAKKEKGKSLWEFKTHEVVYGAIGAALYGVFSWVTNIIPLPAAGNITFRPAVAVLIFFGIAYGPWVGLIAGLVGNILGDAITGWGFWWHWDIGNGLMGMIPGLVMNMIKQFNKPRDISIGVGFGALGIAVGMLFGSLMETVVGGIDIKTALLGYFTPAFLGNLVVTIVLLPILMVAYHAVVSRRGR